MRTLHDAEDLFAEAGRRQRFHLVVDFEAERGQKLRKRRAGFREFNKPLQLDAAVAE